MTGIQVLNVCIYVLEIEFEVTSVLWSGFIVKQMLDLINCIVTLDSVYLYSFVETFVLLFFSLKK